MNQLYLGVIKLETREKLAGTAFSHTSFYDTLIADYFESEFNLEKEAIRLNYPIKNSYTAKESIHFG